MPGPSITDWISAGSSFAATGIAGLMAYLAYKQYLKAPLQEAEPDNALAEDKETAPIQVVVFKTSKQQTTLTISSHGLECHLEDRQPGKSGRQWVLEISEVRRIIAKGDYSVDPGYRVQTGTFSIGRRKRWLYSKTLFPEPEYLHGTLTNLLERVIKKQT